MFLNNHVLQIAQERNIQSYNELANSSANLLLGLP